MDESGAFPGKTTGGGQERRQLCAGTMAIWRTELRAVSQRVTGREQTNGDGGAKHRLCGGVGGAGRRTVGFVIWEN